MNKSVWLLIPGMFSLFCSSPHDSGTDFPTQPEITVTIYESDGARPAAGATIKAFDISDTGGKPVFIRSTGDSGSFSVADLPDGIYNFWAEKDSFVLFQDSVVMASPFTTLQDDTLECPSSLNGVINLQPQDDPRLVNIRVAGSGRRSAAIDVGGKFTVTGLASGSWPLLVRSSLPEYLPMIKNVQITPCSNCTIPDTIRLTRTGIPIVTGILVSQDTLHGIIDISWNKTDYRKYQDYVIFRDLCSVVNLSDTPAYATEDTFFVDSIYSSLKAAPSDSAGKCIRYRIAVRDNMQEIGPVYHYIKLPFAPKSAVTTFFSHKVGYAETGCDSASINDTVVFSLTAKNRTRPLRTLYWYDPVDNDTIFTKSPADTLLLEVTDTIRHAFDSSGNRRLVVVAVDNAGQEWSDTVPAKIVTDVPNASAGPDVGVLTGNTVDLHGSATQRFGAIAGWEWKIGAGDWKPASSPDTAVTAPLSEETVTCSLAVIDDDGNRGVDAMMIITSCKVQDISAGYYFSLILKTDSTLWACGMNEMGQLGIGRDITANPYYFAAEYLPVKVMTNVREMSAGNYHSLIIKTDGTLLACGGNDYGQLGDGTRSSRFLPVEVMNDVQHVSAGGMHSLILKNDGTLWACGNNDYGQLGDGTTATRTVPVRIMSDVQDMAAGNSLSMILTTDGTLWVCGTESGYLYFYDTLVIKETPVKIMTGVTDIDAGTNHYLLLKNDGTLWAWGQNYAGQLGDGTMESQPQPVKVLTDVKSCAAGSYYSLALTAGGTLWACGANDFGQLGNGSSNVLPTFEQVMTDVQDMAASGFHTMILKTDGTLWACGENYGGQLGDGTGEIRHTPVQIIPQQRFKPEIEFYYKPE